MRLTLPVLLDYLDQRLDPAAAGEVEARLQRDPAAQALLQRAKLALEQNQRRAAGTSPTPATWMAFVLRAAPTLLLLAALCAVIFFGTWWFDAAWSSPPEDAPPNLHPVARSATELGTGAEAIPLSPPVPASGDAPVKLASGARSPDPLASSSGSSKPMTSASPNGPAASQASAADRSGAGTVPPARPSAQQAGVGANAGRRASEIAQRPTPRLTGVRRVDPSLNTTPDGPAPRDPAVRPASLESPPIAAAPTGNAPFVCGSAEFAEPDDVLVRYDSEARLWKLVPRGDRISVGKLLLAPPVGRATIVMLDGLSVDLQPETLVEFEAPAPGEPPTIRVWFGRIRLSAPQDDRRLNVAAGSWKASLVFPRGGAVASVEVRPFTRPGVDPKAGAEERAIEVRVAREAVLMGGEPQAALHVAPARIVVAPHPGDSPNAAGANATAPGWTTAREPLSVEDQRVLTILRERASGDASLLSALGVLVHDRNPAVRHTATHWLACLGDFGPLVDELGAEDLLVLWRDESVAALAHAVARGPLWAKRVEHALLVERGPQGRELFRMLWGYSPEQLREGASLQLVERLDHHELDVRVLAFWNLQTLTGVGLHYRPELPALQRKPLIDRWKERVALEQLTPAVR
ncbi:MAG TPA: hypothetical protein VGE52_19025 [Pirellulales bacterium]